MATQQSSTYTESKDHTNHNSILLGNQLALAQIHKPQRKTTKNMDDLIPDMRDLLRELRLLRKAIVHERKTNESPVRLFKYRQNLSSV